MSGRLDELLAVMARLRGEGGCPWDREQTFASIAPYAIEEAYEVADAAERGDHGHLREELGDLLFQVVFHAQMAREAGLFDFDAVAVSIRDKLVRRHPHVFGGGAPLSAAEQSLVWEDINARERGARPAAGAAGAHGLPVSHLEDVPRTLPALMRACKLSKRAARAGFDFDAAAAAADKVAEELAEVREAQPASAALFEEIGDLLFAVANLARKLEVDAESALRAANAKFERRFRGMEALAAARGIAFDSLDLVAQEALWQEVKRGE